MSEWVKKKKICINFYNEFIVFQYRSVRYCIHTPQPSHHSVQFNLTLNDFEIMENGLSLTRIRWFIVTDQRELNNSTRNRNFVWLLLISCYSVASAVPYSRVFVEVFGRLQLNSAGAIATTQNMDLIKFNKYKWKNDFAHLSRPSRPSVTFKMYNQLKTMTLATRIRSLNFICAQVVIGLWWHYFLSSLINETNKINHIRHVYLPFPCRVIRMHSARIAYMLRRENTPSHTQARARWSYRFQWIYVFKSTDAWSERKSK